MNNSKSPKLEKKPFLGKVILLLLGIQLVILPIRIDNYQFLVFSLAPLMYILANVLNAERFPIRIVPLDIAWLLFTLWGFVSILWATNISLVWFSAFGWLTMILWMILIRSMFDKMELNKILFNFFQALFVILLLYYLCFFIGKVVIQDKIVINTETGILNQLAIVFKLPIREYRIHTNGQDFWNLIFGYNCNVTALYAVLLLPFILFNQFSFSIDKVIKFCSIVIVVLLLYQASSIGVIIAFAALVGYYLWTLRLANYIKLFTIMIGIAFLTFLIVFLYDSNLIQHAPIIKELVSLRDGGRYLTVLDAFRIFTEKPILGSGLGNWLIDAHKDYLTDTEYLNHIFPINHVIYSLVLAELGIVGFGIFISILAYLVYRNLKIGRQLTPIKKAAFGSFMVYAIALLFYNGATLKPLFFCKAQLIAFCSIGIMTYNRKNSIQVFLWHKLIFLLLGLGSFVWFTYTLITNNRYTSISKKEKITNPEKAFNKLKEIYNPVFKTDYGRNESLSFELAQLAIHHQEYHLARIYFQQAIKENTNNEDVLIGYARFLLRNDSDLINASKYINLARAIKKDNSSIVMSAVELAIDSKEYATAKVDLSKINFPVESRLIEKLLEIKLYSSSYIEEIIQLTLTQNYTLSNYKIKQIDFQKSVKTDLVRLEDLLLYRNEGAMDLLEERIFDLYNQMESLYFSTLTDDQFRVYLLDKYAAKTKKILDDFSIELNLSKEQKRTIYQLILESRIQRKILKLQIDIDQELIGPKQKELRDIMRESSIQLKEILTTQQYKRYFSLSRFNSNNIDTLLY